MLQVLDGNGLTWHLRNVDGLQVRAQDQPFEDPKKHWNHLVRMKIPLFSVEVHTHSTPVDEAPHIIQYTTELGEHRTVEGTRADVWQLLGESPTMGFRRPSHVSTRASSTVAEWIPLQLWSHTASLPLGWTKPMPISTENPLASCLTSDVTTPDVSEIQTDISAPTIIEPEPLSEHVSAPETEAVSDTVEVTHVTNPPAGIEPEKMRILPLTDEDKQMLTKLLSMREPIASLPVEKMIISPQPSPITNQVSPTENEYNDVSVTMAPVEISSTEPAKRVLPGKKWVPIRNSADIKSTPAPVQKQDTNIQPISQEMTTGNAMRKKRKKQCLTFRF